MEAINTPKVKICCISSIEEAQLAIRYGASALGLVSKMPSGPGPIAESLIAAIAAIVPPGVATFLLTAEQDPHAIIEQQRRCRCNTIQLVDAMAPESYALLRAALPGIALVQVVHVVGEASIAEAVALAPHVDAILLDSGNPALAIKELGGTGRRHDWSLSRKIREQINVPLFLAGGLTPEDAQTAVATVAPFGLDICSGVRTDDRLDETKLSRFFTVLQQLVTPS